MRIRLRAPGGASTITLKDDATVGELISQIAEKTAVPSFDIKYGYPPKPLLLQEVSLPLNRLDVKLDREQLTISPRDAPSVTGGTAGTASPIVKSIPSDSVARGNDSKSTEGLFSFTNVPGFSSQSPEKKKSTGPVSLSRKSMAGDVPELPLPERGATLGMYIGHRLLSWLGYMYAYKLTLCSSSSDAG